MPYIHKAKRDKFDCHVDLLIQELLDDPEPGNLNYVLTRLVGGTRAQSYSSYNEALGVIEAVKIEFYRRVVSYYEDDKVVQNGDVQELRPPWSQYTDPL